MYYKQKEYQILGSSLWTSFKCLPLSEMEIFNLAQEYLSIYISVTLRHDSKGRKYFLDDNECGDPDRSRAINTFYWRQSSSVGYVSDK